MISAGIDIGSRTIKIVLMQDGEILQTLKEVNTFDTIGLVNKMLGDLKYDTITATGYGRHLFGNHFECNIISEIKAFALGAEAFHPGKKTILDIGGQDTKAIAVDSKGKMQKFEMNDKCSAGTGKFLEIMAMTLGYSIDKFGSEALSADSAQQINNMCTVFAESEVISLIAKGVCKKKIAAGIHSSVARRAMSLVNRVCPDGKLVFTGGVALNQCMKKHLEDIRKDSVIIPKLPQLTGAVGCAIYGSKSDHAKIIL